MVIPSNQIIKSCHQRWQWLIGCCSLNCLAGTWKPQSLHQTSLTLFVLTKKRETKNTLC